MVLWSSAKGFEPWQNYVILPFFLWQNCRLLNSYIYNHLFSPMRNFTTDISLRASQSNWYNLLELSLTWAGDPASGTRSPACLCLYGERRWIKQTYLGQQPALLDILSPFQEVLPDCQSLPNLLADHCLLTLAFVNNQGCVALSDILFHLKWWTLPALNYFSIFWLM